MRLSLKLEQNMWTGSELVVHIVLALDTLSVLQPDLLSSIIQYNPRGIVQVSNCPRPKRVVRSPAWRAPEGERAPRLIRVLPGHPLADPKR